MWGRSTADLISVDHHLSSFIYSQTQQACREIRGLSNSMARPLPAPPIASRPLPQPPVTRPLPVPEQFNNSTLSCSPSSLPSYTSHEYTSAFRPVPIHFNNYYYQHNQTPEQSPHQNGPSYTEPYHSHQSDHCSYQQYSDPHFTSQNMPVTLPDPNVGMDGTQQSSSYIPYIATPTGEPAELKMHAPTVCSNPFAPSINVEMPSDNLQQNHPVASTTPIAVTLSEPMVTSAPMSVPAISVASPKQESSVPTAPTISVAEPDAGNNGASLPQISVAVTENSSSPSSPPKQPTTNSQSSFTSPPAPVLKDSIEPTIASISTSLTCAGCHVPIDGRTVSAMGVRWHSECFICSHPECKETLEHLEFHEADGKPWCHLHFHEEFSLRCYHCRTPIVDENYITIEDPSLGKRVYHELHFFCAECGDPFMDPKSLQPMHRDTHIGPSSSPNDAHRSKPFVVHNGHCYCERCHINLRKPKCARCRKPIVEDVLEAMGKNFHEGCFTCQRCQNPFEHGNFFVKINEPLCDRCYKVALVNEVS